MRAHETLTKQEIARRLQGLMMSRRGHVNGSRVPIAAVADFVGVSRQTLYNAMRGYMQETLAVRLSWFFARLDRDEFRFERRGPAWEPVFRPPEEVKPQPRMAVELVGGQPQLAFLPPEPRLPTVRELVGLGTVTKTVRR